MAIEIASDSPTFFVVVDSLLPFLIYREDWPAAKI
jgi:hypothetical protein